MRYNPLIWKCLTCETQLSEVDSAINKKYCAVCKIKRLKELERRKYLKRRIRNGGKVFTNCMVCGRKIQEKKIRKFCSVRCRRWKQKEKLLEEQKMRLINRAL
jgi:predicted nucleic acid-binding Zn ribbon protein